MYIKATTVRLERPTLYFGQINFPSVTDCKCLDITIFVKNCDSDLKRKTRKFMPIPICY